MIKRSCTILSAITLLLGCATVPLVRSDGASTVSLNQRADLGEAHVTVLNVLEDSRCPVEVDCFWAGRVKLSVRIELGSGTSLRELASDQPLQVADGVLALVATDPAKSTQRTIAPGDYRFALKFSGGL